jgi:hypothetical protein
MMNSQNAYKNIQRACIVKQEGNLMEAKPSLITKPSALIPLAMAFSALALVVGHALVYGIVHETDEGAAAHIFQLLMVIQVPFVAYFAIKWLPQEPKQALLILALQAAIVVAAFAGVYFLT